ncbi:hypothetical protein PoB_006292900 [Plakobranchus ocellatus]|uniref:Uncharacterized protein n=1 Tax=Plakobranchus ocellatus TaxID=259542 RepID=A0AAV4CWZ7_9GAST|nr:hypothetical protein PoB_006292900 [Plakobranchus ocellatus]
MTIEALFDHPPSPMPSSSHPFLLTFSLLLLDFRPPINRWSCAHTSYLSAAPFSARSINGNRKCLRPSAPAHPNSMNFSSHSRRTHDFPCDTATLHHGR